MNLIIGLGITGLSCLRYFQRQGMPVAIMDTRANPPGLAELKANFPNVPLYLGGLDKNIISQAQEIIASPGIALPEFSPIGDIELFARTAKAPIVAITGTNGKGTVTTLVGNMAQQAGLNVRVGGNIGIPALDLLSDTEPDLYVLEISSFQLETTYSLQASVATILNISEDHGDRYTSREDYIAAKQRIYHGTKLAIYNRDDKLTYPQYNVPIQSFGLDDREFGIHYSDNQAYLAFNGQPLLSVNELKIKGQHNWANALAALAIGHALQFPMVAMLQTLCEFKGLHHRCEWVGEWQGISWYDDSKGTNVAATIAALYGLGSAITGKLIWIAGGLGKGADFTPLRAPAEKTVRAAILIGQDAPLLAESIGKKITVYHAKSMEEAVSLAHSVAREGDAVLLSPACASMDMFQNAEQRGEIFKSEVRQQNASEKKS